MPVRRRYFCNRDHQYGIEREGSRNLTSLLSPLEGPWPKAGGKFWGYEVDLGQTFFKGGKGGLEDTDAGPTSEICGNLLSEICVTNSSDKKFFYRSCVTDSFDKKIFLSKSWG